MQGSSTSAYSMAGSGTAGNCIEFAGLSGSGFSLVAAASATRSGQSKLPGPSRRNPDRAVTKSYLDRVAGQRVDRERHPWAKELAGSGRRHCPYLDYSAVNFGDSAASTTVDISAADITPYSVMFSNVATNYTLQSSRGLRHCGHDRPEQVRREGLLTILNTNKFTGPLTSAGAR